MAQRIISGTPYHNVSAALSQNVGTQGANSQDAKTQPAYRTATVYNNYIKKSALIPKAISLFIDYVRHDFQKAELTIQGGGAHWKSWQFFNLTPETPKAKNGITRHLCLEE